MMEVTLPQSFVNHDQNWRNGLSFTSIYSSFLITVVNIHPTQKQESY